MAKADSQFDVLVLGEHPAAYLAAALLKHAGKLRVMHATLPDRQPPDRLVVVNPALFDLHPLLNAVRRRLDLTSIYGLQFLGADAETRSEYRDKSGIVHTTRYSAVRTAICKLAEAEGVELLHPKKVEVLRLDENGLDVIIGKNAQRFTALVLADELSVEQHKMLGVPEAWERDVLHGYAFIRCKTNRYLELSARPIMPMSLDLLGQMRWAWLIPGDGEFQLVVEWPLDGPAVDAFQLMRVWVEILKKHAVLDAKFDVKPAAIEVLKLPLAGALAHEGVANRTLLIGPAGGFYSACGEDIYPNCWSAVYAADVLKKAFREPHLQDALNAFRHQWRTTLGDYLRGPQQNLKFLMPLVYRNPVMTARLTEAILLSKSVVR